MNIGHCPHMGGAALGTLVLPTAKYHALTTNNTTCSFGRCAEDEDIGKQQDSYGKSCFHAAFCSAVMRAVSF
jgi:hypothetical protein